jgi:hypothetical protein
MLLLPQSSLDAFLTVPGFDPSEARFVRGGQCGGFEVPISCAASSL